MAAIPIYPSSVRKQKEGSQLSNPLPQLLQTPSGLALLEMQGTINLPLFDQETLEAEAKANGTTPASEFPIGRLIFPDYNPEFQEANSTAWMKRVYFYVGKHQRLTGEVKKLAKAFAVIRKRRAEERSGNNEEANTEVEKRDTEELEIVEIVKYKILFSQRPEPVGASEAET